MPAIPFTLKLRGLQIKPSQDEMKPVLNKTTNEQLSISNSKPYPMIEINRTRTAEEKKKNSQNSKD